jgi:hypothetical protein
MENLRVAVFFNGAALRQNSSDVILQTAEKSWQEKTVTVSDLPAGIHVVEVGEIDKNPLDIDFLEVTVLNAPDTSDRGSNNHL